MKAHSAGTLLLLLNLTFCNVEERNLHRIEGLIQSEKHAEASAEIEQEFRKSFIDHSDPLEKISPDQRPVVSLDGMTIAWLDGRSLYHRNGEKTRERSLEFEGTGLFLSGNGNRALVLNDLDEMCRYEVIDLTENDSVEIFETAGCDGSPAVTDGGAMFFGRGGILHRVQTGGEKSDLPAEERADRILNLFSAKYKKLDNYHHIQHLPSGDLLVFYGGGGSYRLYLMSEDGSKAELIKEGVASPSLFTALPDNPLLTGQNGAIRSESDPELLVYSGTAGTYTMEAIRISERVRILSTVKRPPISDTLIFFSRNSDFIGVDPSERYYFYHAPEKRSRYLPMRGKVLAVFSEGTIFSDEEFMLLLRKDPFTEYEKKLIELYDRIASEE